MEQLGGARDLAVGPGALTAVLAERCPPAIRHPLGFVCLPLARGEVNVCVHVWTPLLRRAEPTTSLIHCHSWDLTSQVLSGRLRNETIHVADDSTTPTSRVFEVRSSGCNDMITPTDRLVCWERAHVASHHAGDEYEVPGGSFHMTVVPDGCEVVTVVSARSRPDLTDLSLGRPDLTSHTVSRERCDPDEAALAMATVVRLLALQDHGVMP